MKISDIKSLMMDKICLYDIDDMGSRWTGYIENMPTQYLDLEIRMLGAKRRGIMDVGVDFMSLSEETGD